MESVLAQRFRIRTFAFEFVFPKSISWLKPCTRPGYRLSSVCTDALAAWISDHSGVWRVETGTGTVLYSVSEVAGRCTVVGETSTTLRYTLAFYYRSTLPSVVPRLRRRGHCRAPPVARCMQRPLVVQVQPLERGAAPTPRSPVPTDSRPNPHPQIDQRRVRAQRAVEGTHAAQHARCGRKRAQPARRAL